ncbi:MAG: Stp1/IreP family PP2C-type Ser/Thr phosphatase [Hydrococcus sp. C42_A2020_068]|uniref:Stp1/IreP family PP2C-type Ser/Thr phosphatase n=1 Tax=Pleurocapsa sp. PCC 7327 TaxID=118163 RepID=UPI00029FB130|nr:Stp1/IreP family PP2C-type Ser/Thr phosphatase [Pleurocapsa sp. PCC 7327]AFY79287.1 serine/threonine protein phosphatase [Pleurocapsa sp. PCC 7327]MBF2019906.1 Stp1/IreP family PP2C-type Ser/Thr phosphatase [Hydrococcus sp. C42_A2020_068]
MMKRRFTGLTDPGLLRSVNQDNFYLDPEGRFFIVADGMGGHAGGQEASQIATKRIAAYLDEHWDSDMASDVLLEEALKQANQGILEDQYDHPERGDMGTTAVVVAFRQNQPWYAHIGDSRLYRLRDSQLEQISEDHTWVARALKVGDISPEQAKVHPWRHVLFQCLGRKDLHQMDIYPLDVKAGDRLLMCSDGLTEEVPDELISEVLQSSKTCEEAATQLVEAAKKAGGSDNITVVIIVQD